ncbi:MAG: hypothetical protein J7M25_02675 [Deltaproteobacteria bacterium]|nr:hypothetical protein [Deltaproteobacteria bacterium]
MTHLVPAASFVQTIPGLEFAATLLTLLAALVAVLLRQSRKGLLATGAVLTAAGLFETFLLATGGASTTSLFHDILVVDPLSRMGTLGLTLVALAAIERAQAMGPYNQHLDRSTQATHIALMLVAITAMKLTLLGNDILVIILCLELAWAPAIWLASNMSAPSRTARRPTRSSRATVYASGVLSVGLLLLAAALFQRASGNTTIPTLAGAPARSLILAIPLLAAGLAWKAAVPPFGVGWPDFATDSPPGAWILMDGGLKITLALVTIRIVSNGFAQTQTATSLWHPILLAIGLTGLIFGGLAAAWQHNVRQVTAHSMVSLMSWVLVGLVPASSSAPWAFGAKIGVLLLLWSSLVGFVGLVILSDSMERTRQDPGVPFPHTWYNLGRRRPLITLAVIVLVGNAFGVPLTPGFFARLAIVSAMFQGHLVIAVVLVALWLLGMYPLLRLLGTLVPPAHEVSGRSVPAGLVASSASTGADTQSGPVPHEAEVANVPQDEGPSGEQRTADQVDSAPDRKDAERENSQVDDAPRPRSAKGRTPRTEDTEPIVGGLVLQVVTGLILVAGLFPHPFWKALIRLIGR